MDYLTGASISSEKILWMETFLPKAPKKSRDALDLGCGAGLYSQWLTQRNWSVQALDIHCPPNIQGIKTITHNLEEGLHFPDHSFDLLLAWDVLEHLVEERRMWDEIGRVLRPDGILIGSVPHNADQRLQRYNLTFKHHIDKTHQRVYSPKEIEERIFSIRLIPTAIELKGPVSPQFFSEFIAIKQMRRPLAFLIGAARRMGFLKFGELYADIFFTARKEAP